MAQPEIKARHAKWKRERRMLPEVKEELRAKERIRGTKYRKNPEFQEKSAAYHKAHNQIAEVKARRNEAVKRYRAKLKAESKAKAT